MGSLGAVTEKKYELIETGEYVFTLNDLEFSSGGKFGDSLKWTWLLAPKEDPTNYLARDDGMEKTLWQFTDADLYLDSRQHEWAQALTGRILKADDAPPEDDDLIGKRMLAHLTHDIPKKGNSAGKKREKITAGSAKAFALPGAKSPVVMAQKGREPLPVIGPSAAQVSADPSEAELDRALIVADVERLIKRAEKLQSSGHVKFLALMPDGLKAASIEELKVLQAEIATDIERALDE